MSGVRLMQRIASGLRCLRISVSCLLLVGAPFGRNRQQVENESMPHGVDVYELRRLMQANTKEVLRPFHACTQFHKLKAGSDLASWLVNACVSFRTDK